MIKSIRTFILAAFIPALLSCSADAVLSGEQPPVWPDYKEVVVPVNIAPMNFGICADSDYSRMKVEVLDSAGTVVLKSAGKRTSFRLRRWRKILSFNAGGLLTFNIRMRGPAGWTSFAPFTMKVSRDSIDYGLTYRRILPGYQSFGYMAIYERSLSDFKERKLIDSRMLDAGCVNCHSQNKADPSQYSLHVRGAHSATLLSDGETEKYLDTKTDSTGGFFVYPYWHPSGKYVAYSVNTTRQSFYSSHEKKIEVYDEASDVIVYCVDTEEILRPMLLSSKSSFETQPAFSPDGRTLYFCVSPGGELPRDIKKMKYSLCSVAFNPEDGTFASKVDTLLSSSLTGLSFSFPRPSYDGRYILLAAAEYGTFQIWHKEADLWMYDINDGTLIPAGGINSEDADSFHNWSTNSKWAVVASRRDDGLHTRLYIAHLEDDGTFGKAFLLPQRNPVRYYRELMDSYNTPDFTSAPSKIDSRQVRGQVLSDIRVKVELRND
ncbi:MAG: hypothetical protein ACI4TU_09365 [Candidatus Cryptobacteroides sp.]